jgi:NTP pyrophosphatase (non-canonical NTP hydrolase)
MTEPLRLDDLYKMVAHIYSDTNLSRTSTATFAHFVEVCGMLTIHDRKKKRENVTVTDALRKALGWYFPLLAKFNIASVEGLVFRKFPYACPYCRLTPHRDAECKLVRGTSTTVDHLAVSRLYIENNEKRPVTLDDWQKMFQEIYPREADDRGRSTIGLLEELGELAEAIRVYEKYPKYFMGEAADTFSYIMGIANEHALRLRQDEDVIFSFEEEFLRRYPGLCVQCGSRICNCPPVPDATVGRMAKEIDIGAGETLFIGNREVFHSLGEDVCQKVLERVGGYQGLTDRFPFDRGDTNHALVTLCLKMAIALQNTRPELAEKLRAEALSITSSLTYAGSPRVPSDMRDLIAELRLAWSELDKELRLSIRADQSLVGEIAELIEVRRVLFVTCSPLDQEPLRVGAEFRAVQQAKQYGPNGGAIAIEHLSAATVEDFRRAIIRKAWDVIHFSGHGNADHLAFETNDSGAALVPLSSVADLISREGGAKCVILNACSSGVKLIKPIGDITVAMADEVDDDATIAFSAGFYDALAAGKGIVDAIEIGINAVSMNGFDATSIKVIQ